MNKFKIITGLFLFVIISFCWLGFKQNEITELTHIYGVGHKGNYIEINHHN